MTEILNISEKRLQRNSSKPKESKLLRSYKNHLFSKSYRTLVCVRCFSFSWEIGGQMKFHIRGDLLELHRVFHNVFKDCEFLSHDVLKIIEIKSKNKKVSFLLFSRYNAVLFFFTLYLQRNIFKILTSQMWHSSRLNSTFALHILYEFSWD